MFKNIIVSMSLLITPMLPAMSAGDGSGSVNDLIFPAINFILLFGFIIYKYKNVMSKGYSDESVRIKNLLSDAAEADKQASLKLDSLKEQLSEIGNLKNDLKEKAASKLNEQVDLIKQENQIKLKKLNQDKINRFEQEKSNRINNLNSKILDMVISDARDIVSSDSSKRKNTEQNILSTIQ